MKENDRNQASSSIQRSRSVLRTVSLAVLLLSVVGCGGGQSNPANPPSDTTPPSVAITAPADGATVGGLVSVTAIATDKIGVARVEFYVDGVLKAADTSSPYSYAWETSSTANGRHTLQAKAYDAAGNIGSSSSVSVTVSNVVTPKADPTLLPTPPDKFTPPQAPNWGAYNALNVPGMAAGSSYCDPTSNVKIWKVTSATVPLAATGAGVDYSEGGPYISRPWGPNKDQYTLLIFVYYHDHWLVDFQMGVGFSNWRTFPAGTMPASDLHFAFSNKETTPQIAYIDIGSQIIRFNTATMQAENTGYFPVSSASGGWLHQDKNDLWFVKHLGNPATAIWAWNSATNEVRTQTAPNIDEPHLERNGRYVAINADNFSLYVWDLQTNTMEIPNTTGISHEASLLGFWMSANTQNAAPWFEVRNDPTTNPPTYYQINTAAAGGEFHLSGQWIQESSTLPGNDPLKQWYVVSTWSTWPPPRVDLGYPWLYIYAVGYQRADGSDRRFLCHTYGSAYQAGDYATLPFATQSPDGKLVMFNSDMGVRPGRVDVFLVEVPQR